MAIRLRSGKTGATLTVDPTVNAARTILYDSAGNAVFSKTINRFVLAQVGTPGTTVIAAARAGYKLKIVGAVFTLSAAGTVKFTGASDLTGAMDVAAQGGFVIPPNAIFPYVETGVGEALSIVTTGGGANGVILYIIET